MRPSLVVRRNLASAPCLSPSQNQFSKMKPKLRCRPILPIFIGWIALAVGGSAPALTIDQAVTGALRNNLDLRAASYEVDKARGRLLQAGLWPNPELELNMA